MNENSSFSLENPTTVEVAKKFFLKTRIDENTHSVAFCTPSVSTLIDLYCKQPGYLNRPRQTGEPEDLVTGAPSGVECQYAVAMGTNGKNWPDGKAQGHRDADCFATYAIATYINTVYWYRAYEPRDRAKYLE
ncbi:hypothetical protein N657DRAFT_683532 [Parathielavia appendiculata]|uniref:Uncharacterized protein n=1 Tax=Parathielavia appendiculata TaxID=2587402 RepID=A0AAN6Z0R0_9PEZI|nr:hypothetical protein N657DRAFT_683532 [Parathielavia appendiculata]